MYRNQVIPLLWVMVCLNMAFADVLSLFLPGTIQQLQTGMIEGVTMTPMLLLVAAGLIQICTAMVVLSLVLPNGLNRLANLIAAPIAIVFVVGGGSLAPHYLLLASVEVIALLIIAWLAWTWTNEPLLDARM